MAFAKAEALTMVCMKNRFWTLIASCINKKDARKERDLLKNKNNREELEEFGDVK